MGKGKIVSHMGGGQYKVDVYHQSSRPEKMVKYYHDLYLTTYQDELLAADDAVKAAKDAFYNESTKPNGLDTIILLLAEAIQEYTFLLALGESAQGGTKAINQARAKVKGLLSACAIATEELERLRGEWILAIEAREEVVYRFKEYARLEAVWQIRKDKAVAVNEQNLWCIDLSETTTDECGGYPTIPDGTEVGLIDVDCIGDEETTHIDSAYPTGIDNKYSALDHGMLEHKSNQIPEGWIYNMAMYPGMVTWAPKWGFADIIAIDHDTNTCTVQRYASWTAQQDSLPHPRRWDSDPIAEPVDPFGDLISYDNVTFNYMSCHSAAFKIMDSVIITVGNDGKPLEVIGFQKYPRGCGDTRIKSKDEGFTYNRTAEIWEHSYEAPDPVPAGNINWINKNTCLVISWFIAGGHRYQPFPVSTQTPNIASRGSSSFYVGGSSRLGPGGIITGCAIQNDGDYDWIIVVVSSAQITGYSLVGEGYTTSDYDWDMFFKKKLVDVLADVVGSWTLFETIVGTPNQIPGPFLFNSSGTGAFQIVGHGTRYPRTIYRWTVSLSAASKETIVDENQQVSSYPLSKYGGRLMCADFDGDDELVADNLGVGSYHGDVGISPDDESIYCKGSCVLKLDVNVYFRVNGINLFKFGDRHLHSGGECYSEKVQDGCQSSAGYEDGASYSNINSHCPQINYIDLRDMGRHASYIMSSESITGSQGSTSTDTIQIDVLYNDIVDKNGALSSGDGTTINAGADQTSNDKYEHRLQFGYYLFSVPIAALLAGHYTARSWPKWDLADDADDSEYLLYKYHPLYLDPEYSETELSYWYPSLTEDTDNDIPYGASVIEGVVGSNLFPIYGW